MKFKLIIATRVSLEDFENKTPIGQSLRYFSPKVEICVFPNNSIGLPNLYNNAIKKTENETILIFMHDDVFITDYFWLERIEEGLSKFDIVGVVGNKKRVNNQPSWAFIEKKGTKFTWDKKENLSGVIGHGDGFIPLNISYFGKSRQKVLLLDGVFMATKIETLKQNNLLFDNQFDFHFYDMDLCRQAEVKGISCGTWDLFIIHKSIGSFKSEKWEINYEKYLKKWND